jgi:hypothetical protein
MNVELRRYWNRTPIAYRWGARRQQAETVPPGGAPTLADVPAVQHDVPDAAIGQAPAHGQAGMASADDHSIRARHVVSPSAINSRASRPDPGRPGRLKRS